MTLIEISIISLFSFIQSIFGIGLLLLGTPTFLLLGYSYFEVLNLLLPFSIIISAFQIFFSRNTDKKFIYRILIFSIPLVIFGLFIAKLISDNSFFIILISIILILFSSINLFNFNYKIFSIKKNLNLTLLVLGFIHGLTNLGGTLLGIIASNLSKKKNLIRYNIACGYFLFAFFQLFIINVFYIEYDSSNLRFILIPIIIFFLSNIIFKKIENKIFFKLLNLIIFIYGFYIFIKIFTLI